MSVDLSPKQIREFQHHILSWYESNRRDLPWREIPDGISLDLKAYMILVSEVMSQQTQITRVVPKYEAWIKELPNVQSLANAPVSTVLRLWSGLGYNRRALFLQKVAQEVVVEYQGAFPHTAEELEKLPGIGKYTASAVACFSFEQQIPVVDTNIRKVIAVHFFDGVLPPKKIIEETAKKLLPEGKAAIWNQALMDYAAAELKAHKIPIPKQSKLLGSDRYYRGQTLKYLVHHQNEIVTKDSMLTFFEEGGYPCDSHRYDRILRTMEKEGFIVINPEQLLLPD